MPPPAAAELPAAEPATLPPAVAELVTASPEVRWAGNGPRPAATAAAEPTLRIGQIEVFVAAPEPPRAERPASPSPRSRASRSYLRSL